MSVVKISLEKIIPNPQQPRRHFDQQKLNELAQSIKENGLGTPILLEDRGDGTYYIVYGERRFRAHKLIGAKTIEAIIRPLSNHNGITRLVDATAENVARDDMNPVDEAFAYGKMREGGMSVTEIARRVGTSTVNIYGKVKILKFSEEEQELMASGKLPVVTAALDALLSIPNPEQRIEMSKRLALKSASGAVVQRACATFLLHHKQQAKNKREKIKGTTATRLLDREELPEWDALYQVGKVPPWKIFTESVMDTCDSCSLRPSASDATCGTCPVVTMVYTTLKKARE